MIYISDEATETEVAELAAEQRTLTAASRDVAIRTLTVAAAEAMIRFAHSHARPWGEYEVANFRAWFRIEFPNGGSVALTGDGKAAYWPPFGPR